MIFTSKNIIKAAKQVGFDNVDIENLLTQLKSNSQLKEYPDDERTMSYIYQAVCLEFKTEIKIIKGKSRFKPLPLARCITGALIYELTDLSTTETGAEIKRDHSTILHYCQNVENTDYFRKPYQEMKQKVINQLTN